MKHLETIKLGFGSNLIMGNCPDKLPHDVVIKKLQEQAQEIESFGLFDSNQANYNTYYPDVTAEDLNPKDSEFIEPVFRALSEVVVHKEWNPVDFSQNGVLRKSMSLLKGATVNSDHETAVGNALGAVKDVFWQEAYTANGKKIPAGINSRLKLDGKSHPRVARAIMMDPPAIHSTSVTVQFLWEQSHPSLSQDEFFRGLGTYDKDGKLITRMATEIKRYHEISLVSHGADPYAQLVNDKGQIVNPVWGDVSYNSANPNRKPASKLFFFDFKTDITSNSEQPTIPTETNNDTSLNSQTKDMNKQFLLALAMVLGLKNKVNDADADFTEDTITEEVVQNAVTAAATDRNTATTQLAEAQQTIADLQAKVTNQANVEALQAQITEATNALREDTKRNYNVIANGAPVQAILDTIANADYKTLKALNTGYTAQLEANFPMTCGDCGSSKVTRGSAKLGEQEEGQEGNATELPKDTKAMAAYFNKQKRTDAIKKLHETPDQK